jgi:hypothetical protein
VLRRAAKRIIQAGLMEENREREIRLASELNMEGAQGEIV